MLEFLCTFTWERTCKWDQWCNEKNCNSKSNSVKKYAVRNNRKVNVYFVSADCIKLLYYTVNDTPKKNRHLFVPLFDTCCWVYINATIFNCLIFSYQFEQTISFNLRKRSSLVHFLYCVNKLWTLFVCCNKFSICHLVLILGCYKFYFKCNKGIRS